MSKVIIIAEAGVNHNGSMELAKKLIDEARLAGADFIKFQTFITELNISKDAKKSVYQEESTGKWETQFEMVKKLELSFNDFFELKHYCEKVGIEFLSTGFDKPSVDFLDSLNPSFYKIPSGEITNKPYLQHIAQKGKNIILSTGMSTNGEIEAAIAVIEAEGIARDRITVLHCNTEYPTPMNDVNLLAMNHIARELGVKVGYSDHTLGIEVPIAAVVLGACVVEKHFTLDRSLPGPDHAASLVPNELKAMVSAIRNVEEAIGGSGIKEPSESEMKNISVARKSLHTLKELNAGVMLCKDDLIALRPGNGISPMLIDEMVGKILNKDVPAHYLLNPEDLI
jgi:N,N'-diacetyllegionaminate synthase